MATTDTTASAANVWRRVVEYIVPALAVAAVAIAPAFYGGRLPDPAATHWGVSGAPDDSGSLMLNIIMIPVITALVSFGPLLATRAPMPRSMARVLVALSWSMAVLFTWIRTYSLEANADAATWDAAGPINGSMMAVAFGGAILAGLAGAWVAGDRPDTGPAFAPATAISVQPGEAVVWTSGAAGKVPALVAPVVIIGAGVATWLVPGNVRFVVGGLLALVALLLSMFGQCRVIVGPQGMRVRLGWFGWPSLRVPVKDIADVTVETINPMAYGGWGLRSVPGATAIVMRAGEGIRVERTNGRALVVSVDDAAVGAGVLLAHVRR